MLLSKEFSYKKTTQALNFFASKQNGHIDKLKALKLIYFADRYHLRKFGSLITNDTYFAMPYGPVASGTKDILEMSQFLSEIEQDYALRFIEPISGTDYIRAVEGFDSAELSASEREALEYISNNFQKLNSLQLSELTHLYPDWKKKENQLKSGQASRVEMDLLDFFEDPDDPALDKLYELSSEEKTAKIDYLHELNSVDSLWNS